MTKQTLRSQNKCADCGYTWYPRGKNLSSACPRCKSSKVGYAGPGLLACLAVLALFYVFGHNSSNPTPQSTAPVALVEESTAASPATSSAEAPVTASMAAPAPEPTPSPPKGDAAAVKPSPEPPVASLRTAESPVIEPPRQDEAKRVYTDEEIARMEDEKQYHGDDPIVRARLGLPSRETKMLSK